MTIHKLTAYQIDELQSLFFAHKVLNFGYMQETGDIIVEYYNFFDMKKGLHTKKIPTGGDLNNIQ